MNRAFQTIQVLAAVTLLSSTAQADVIVGVFSDPILAGWAINYPALGQSEFYDNTSSAVYSINNNTASSALSWGTFNQDVGSTTLNFSEILFSGGTVPADPTQPFQVGTIVYLNGTSSATSLIFGATLSFYDGVVSPSTYLGSDIISINTTQNFLQSTSQDADYINICGNLSNICYTPLEAVESQEGGNGVTANLEGQFINDPMLQLTGIALAAGQSLSTNGFIGTDPPLSTVPEPGSFALAGGGLLGLTLMRRRRPGYAFTLALAFVVAATVVTLWSPLRAQSSGYYRPVTPPPAQAPPCGHIGTAPCPVAQSGRVTIPPNATPDQVYQMALQAQRRHDISAKMQYMERAAAMGQINAMTGFGVDLVYGRDVAPDLNRGLALLEKAAAQNHPAALFQLGTLYDNGDFERQNTAKAAQLMAGAANARYWQAEYWMGIAYEIGRGVPRNRQAALAMLDRAAGDGQAGMPQMIAAYLRNGGANKRFANADELNAAFNADFHDRYNAHYYPAGDSAVPGSREWTNRITGNSTACYFAGRPGCPKR